MVFEHFHRTWRWQSTTANVFSAGLLSTMLISLLSGCGTASPPVSTPGSSVSIPVTLGRVNNGAGLRPLVMVSIDGGPVVPVILDTGSSGLRVLATAIGPHVEPAATSGPTHTVRYGLGPFEVRTIHTIVRLGAGQSTVATAGPIAVDAIDPTLDHADARLTRRQQAQGILGIAPSAGSGSRVLSPLVQLPAPFSRGYAITVPAGPDHPAGTLVLGRPTATSRTVILAMKQQPGTYPDGRPGWAKDVLLCWTVGARHDCGPTDLDTGSGHSILPTAMGPTAPGQGTNPPAPTTVEVTTPDGAPLWKYTSTVDAGAKRPTYHQLFAPTQFNTGIGLYLGHTIAWDLDIGHVLITPNSSS